MEWNSAIVAALISVFGLVVLAPLVKLLSFDRAHRLSAEVSLFGFEYSNFAAEAISERLKQILREDVGRFKQLQGIERIKSYVTLTIRNSGKKNVSGITLSLANIFSPVFYQIEEGSATATAPPGSRIAIGDLQPGQQRSVKFWYPNFFGGTFPTIKSTFQITADELDLLKWRMPEPDYLVAKRIWEATKLLFFLVLAGLLGAFAEAIFRKWS
jgi:hypothetical protein